MPYGSTQTQNVHIASLYLWTKSKQMYVLSFSSSSLKVSLLSQSFPKSLGNNFGNIPVTYIGCYWIGIRYPLYSIFVLFYHHYLPRKFLKNDKWCVILFNCRKIDKDNKYLLELRTRCVEKQNKLQETGRDKAASQSETQSETGTVG